MTDKDEPKVSISNKTPQTAKKHKSKKKRPWKQNIKNIKLFDDFKSKINE